MTITLYKKTSKGIYYYTLHDRQGSLFEVNSFTAVWGKNFMSGREKVYDFSSNRAMTKKFRSLVNIRLNAGYQVLYSFARDREYVHFFDTLYKVG